ncbi:hypothetical protein NARC_10221 [Candidatus Nitrosocosmicus arcticus]|uniref:Uncharacterized protein n=1 Tax=Candidatus Nitrosocosmicus arcticus TaxID=2035267 RepID=A0A557SZ00_9ARCH|nr:hypothetical protein NARC_10221 [Candidatus Nitrosocosmicus arcticus]
MREVNALCILMILSKRMNTMKVGMKVLRNDKIKNFIILLKLLDKKDETQ